MRGCVWIEDGLFTSPSSSSQGCCLGRGASDRNKTQGYIFKRWKYLIWKLFWMFLLFSLLTKSFTVIAMKVANLCLFEKQFLWPKELQLFTYPVNAVPHETANCQNMCKLSVFVSCGLTLRLLCMSNPCDTALVISCSKAVWGTLLGNMALERNYTPAWIQLTWVRTETVKGKEALVIGREEAGAEPENHNIWTNSGFRVAVEKIKV